MYKTTICSLSLLYANYNTGRGDYIETFVPFIANLISLKKYKTIKVIEIAKDFSEEYGLIIDYHPMHTILSRCKKRKIVQKRMRQYIPNYREVDKYDFQSSASSELRNQERLISKIEEYANEKYNYDFSKDRIEAALICFLKEYDLEIIFASEENSLLPDVSSNIKEKYIINSFIKMVYEVDDQLFQCIVNFSMGHLVANSILYKELDRYRGKLKGVCFYFDTRIIFRLLGYEGNERQEIYHEFFKTLSNEGAKFFLFRHTYEEIESIMYESLNWVNNPKYDPARANSVTRFFVENSLDELDVQRRVNRLTADLEANEILSKNIIEAPEKTTKTCFNIDEAKLHDFIINTYKKSVPSFNEAEKEYTIQKDIDSIAAIYKLRETNRPRIIKNAGHIFLTTNGALAFSAKRYEKEETGDSYYLPACLTDIFIGTILWLQSPAKLLNVNIRKIVAQCYAALQPDARVLKQFLHKISELKSEGKIDDNDYYLLRTSQVAHLLLEDKTLGDISNYTDKLPFEIIEEIRGDIRKVENKKFQEERISHIKTKKELHTYKEHDIAFTLRINQISNIISVSLSVVVLVFSVWGLIANIYTSLQEPTNKPSVLPIIIYSIFSLISICVLIIKDFRLFLRKFLARKINKFFFSSK